MYRYFLASILALCGITFNQGRCLAQNVLMEPPAGALDIKPDDVIHWQGDTATVTELGTVIVLVRLFTERGFTLYKDQVRFTSPSGFLLENFIAPPVEKHEDPLTHEDVEVYTGGEFELIFKGPGKYTEATFELDIRYIGCTNTICLFPHTEKIKFKVTTSGATDTAVAAPPQPSASSTTVIRQADQPFEDLLAAQFNTKKLAFGWLLVIIFVGGLLTNFTPCVYPMIPITLRLLGKQSRSPFAAGASYALGITGTYTALGSFAALTGSLFGQISASSWLNIAFAIIMAALGFTMLGGSNLAFLQNLGYRVGGKPNQNRGLLRSFLMGAGAGLVAAPCTGPILGMLLTYIASAEGGFGHATGLLFVYSVGFALPYVLLGGAASKLAKVRLPENFLFVVKLVFASIMFALAFYYLRIPAYSLLTAQTINWQLVTIGCLALAGAGLAVLFRIHWQERVTPLTLVAACLGFSMFAGSRWYIDHKSARSLQSLHWLHSEEEAYAQARSENAPLLIDFWAEWCEACKKMDISTFSHPEVIRALKRGRWVLLKLDFTAEGEATSALQEKYQVPSLPALMMLLPPDFRIDPQNTLQGYVSPSALLVHLEKLKGG